MNVVPAYSKVGTEESWSPNVISAQWTSARIVGSAFRVILGEPEKVDEFSDETSKTSVLQGAQAQVQSVTAYPTDSEILILNGETDTDGGDWHMTNPGESGVNTTYIPASGGVPGHFVAYQTTRLAPSTINGASAYPRVIDFRNIPTKNMSNASRDEIVSASYIDPANGAAKAVIEPGTPYSDEWPGHVAIASLYTSVYSGWPNTPILNAFVHTEDISQNDTTLNNPRWVYIRIGYARSTAGTADFGRAFQKLNHQAGNPIITFASAEEEINPVTVATKQYGVGGPSVIATNDYYYMIYYVQTLHKDNGIHYPDPGIAIARASRSAVDNQYYAGSSNPWIKYRQIVSATTAEQNWSQPGLGGLESILWNWKIGANGFRGTEINNYKLWRAFPKVSYNIYLASSYIVNNATNQMVMLCKGGIDAGAWKSGVVMHTSSNLLEWSTFLVLKADQSNDGANDYYSYEYPTLIGVDPTYGGYSGQTCEYNKLYYQRDKWHPTSISTAQLTDQDIYRQTLRFVVSP